MGYAELIQQRLQSLPPDKQAEIYDFVEFLVARSTPIEPATPQPAENARLKHALAEARAAWPRRMTAEEIDSEVAAMRDREWNGRS